MCVVYFLHQSAFCQRWYESGPVILEMLCEGFGWKKKTKITLVKIARTELDFFFLSYYFVLASSWFIHMKVYVSSA